MSLPRVHAILLAAGESRRMGFPKPLLRVGTESFIARTAALALGVADQLVVVLGAYADRVRSAITHDPRIVFVENPNYTRGQLSSLKVGLAAIICGGADAVIVHLADHPLVSPSTFRALLDGYRETASPIAVARHHGHRGHPVLFDRAVFAELMAAPEDQGARVVVNADPSRVLYVEVDDPGVVLDLDTPADLASAGLAPPPSPT
ncbi:MAG TPA: nucleotidyltransferase family protein [Candidatus Binataceae bacterium]|nr:nucleotidyltransferase family protein [Candidatus Binataceae bacterium]